jgi:type II secretory pathway component GspD/PulD (secretin)
MMRGLLSILTLAGLLLAVMPFAIAQEAPSTPLPDVQLVAPEAPAAPAPAPAEAAPAPAEAAPPPAEAAPPPPPPPPPLTDIRQVQIQVWISETNEQGLREIGANLNYSRFVRGEERNGSLQQLSTNVFSPLADFPRVTLPAPQPQGGVNFKDPALRAFDATETRNLTGTDEDQLIANGVQTRSGVGLSSSVIQTDHGTLEGIFRAAETKSDVDLISKPELLVVNSISAEIKAGGQVPYQDVVYDVKGLPQLSVKWKDTGVNMKIMPTIMPNNFVQLQIEQLDVTDIVRIDNTRGVDLPVFASRSQTGFVLVPDGNALVIGGLSSRVIRKSEQRVPLLGSIPILGIPFRGRSSEVFVTNLLVFVSPTIIDLRKFEDAQDSALSFWRKRGNEWRNADRIDKEAESMASEL